MDLLVNQKQYFLYSTAADIGLSIPNISVDGDTRCDCGSCEVCEIEEERRETGDRGRVIEAALPDWRPRTEDGGQETGDGTRRQDDIRSVILSGAKDPYSVPILQADTIFRRSLLNPAQYGFFHFAFLNVRMTIRRAQKDKKPSSEGGDFSPVIDRGAGGDEARTVIGKGKYSESIKE